MSIRNFKIPGNTGGYMITENGEQIKLITGYLNGEVVSPDGCKVAFSHAPYSDADNASSNDPTLRTLKLINFCIEEKRHGK